jgi:hypothetical protein
MRPLAHALQIVPEKADPAVYSFVMRPIGFMHCDLRLDFRKFACKMFSLACVSAGNRVIGCVKVAANASGLGPAPAAILMPFIPGVALTKKILDFGLGGLDHFSQIAEAARVSRRRDQREEAP